MINIKQNQRVRFPRGEQTEFLNKALLDLDMKKYELAKTANVCSITLFDWKREKYNMDLSSLEMICKKFNLDLPGNIEVLPEHWSLGKACRLGGKRYAELYGSPGTLESRRRGGLRSQARFVSDPDYAKKMRFKLRKEIKYPAKSPLLAEFIGIMLGDGGVRNDYQIAVSFNGKEDQAYAIYIRCVAKKLFGISSTLYIRKEKGHADIVVTAINLIEFLQKLGIKKGNKVRNQVDVPEWVFERKEYQAACLRGLFDTDGCIYQHKYDVDGKQYSYVKMCFRNYSIPILMSVEKILKNIGFHPALDTKHKSVYLNRPSEVNKYFLSVKTSNPRYYNKYKRFFSSKIGHLGRVA